MKKITLLTLLFVCAISFGQNRAKSAVEAAATGENLTVVKTVVETPQINKLPEGITSVSELIASGYVFDESTSGQPVSSSIITQVGKSSGGTAVFTNRSDFQAACTGALVFEDFGGGPGGISACGEVISSAGDTCFAAGEIQPGIEISASTLANGTAYFEAGNAPLVDTGVGSDTFVDYTEIAFPSNNVNSFGADLYTVFNAASVQIRLYGTGGLFDTYSVAVANPTFFGFIATETVVRIEIEDLSTSNAEFVSQVEFGSCVATLATYSSRPDFQAACPGLPLENLAGGPGGISACGEVISSAGDTCFPAGEILPGVEISASTLANGTAYFEAGNAPLVDTGVGSNTFVDYTEIAFPGGDVRSFGADLYTVFSAASVNVRVYGTGGLLGTFPVAVSNPTFWGVVANETIVRIEIEDLSTVNAEFIAMFEFGTCPLGVEDAIAELIKVHPNPTKDVLTITIPSVIEVESSIMYDITGRDTGVILHEGAMDLSSLSPGIYILKLNTSAGTLTKKVIKN